MGVSVYPYSGPLYPVGIAASCTVCVLVYPSGEQGSDAGGRHQTEWKVSSPRAQFRLYHIDECKLCRHVVVSYSAM